MSSSQSSLSLRLHQARPAIRSPFSCLSLVDELRLSFDIVHVLRALAELLAVHVFHSSGNSFSEKGGRFTAFKFLTDKHENFSHESRGVCRGAHQNKDILRSRLQCPLFRGKGTAGKDF